MQNPDFNEEIIKSDFLKALRANNDGVKAATKTHMTISKVS
jgi:hypothetical protein